MYRALFILDQGVAVSTDAIVNLLSKELVVLGYAIRIDGDAIQMTGPPFQVTPGEGHSLRAGFRCETINIEDARNELNGNDISVTLTEHQKCVFLCGNRFTHGMSFSAYVAILGVFESLEGCSVVELKKDPKLHPLAERFLSAVGSKKFDEFAHAVHGVCQGKGRLMFWQEKLWQDFCEVEGSAPSFEDLPSIFPLFSRAPITLAEYRDHCFKELNELGIEAFEYQHEIGRYLSKTGELGSDEQLLRMIKPALATTDVLKLFHRLKTYGRHESEWRAQFEAIFPEVANKLPPIEKPL